MPNFVIISTVSANSMGEALERAREVEGSMEVLDTVSRSHNTVQYAVDGYVGGVERKGDYHSTWQEALRTYLLDFPHRFEHNREILVLKMAANGDDAEPVWEVAFYDHIVEQGIKVYSVRDPRDSSDQLVKG